MKINDESHDGRALARAICLFKGERSIQHIRRRVYVVWAKDAASSAAIVNDFQNDF